MWPKPGSGLRWIGAPLLTVWLWGSHVCTPSLLSMVTQVVMEALPKISADTSSMEDQCTWREVWPQGLMGEGGPGMPRGGPLGLGAGPELLGHRHAARAEHRAQTVPSLSQMLPKPPWGTGGRRKPHRYIWGTPYPRWLGTNLPGPLPYVWPSLPVQGPAPSASHVQRTKNHRSPGALPQPPQVLERCQGLDNGAQAERDRTQPVPTPRVTCR